MRRLFRSSAFAGIFAFLILLMNVFPYAAIAAAEGLQPGNMAPGNMAPGNMAPGNMAPGNMQPGKLQPGDLHWDTSQYQPGDMRPGDLGPGDMRPGDLGPGDMQPGDLGPGDMRPGDLGPGDMQPGDLGPGDMQPGDLGPGDMQPGDVRPGDMQPGDVKPGEIRPGSTEPGNLQPNLEPPKQYDQFAYDAFKLSFKEVVGGTLGYTASLIDSGEVDYKALLKGKGLFFAGLGLKTMETVFKDTDYETYAGLGVTGFDAKAAWDSYKFILQQNPNSNFARMNFNQPFLGNGLETIRMPGIVKGLNVGAAGISLLFDGYDTWDNFDQAFNNPRLSESEQNEKFVEGVGSAGSSLMDLGVIVSVIPGAQAAGAVIFAVGAGLWVVSKLVKYSDKLAGGAITRGIRNGVSKAVGWVKSIFA
ncbi:hypothetical protein G3578_17900 [Brevibacillus sp. SYP-B805]|uniref:hypothetical protein n=1 Tax=Brevibacillus sp. SYP-B805 TaxID=1578199 RepID=UPI0013EBBCE6|nr:hypothetical protein [Brevibacillus sp. SYP-B805]NGQ97039.1 hypothetical protein [Brevibacillus sp. SYP-B805]